jgi:hypothetical protein
MGDALLQCSFCNPDALKILSSKTITSVLGTKNHHYSKAIFLLDDEAKNNFIQ